MLSALKTAPYLSVLCRQLPKFSQNTPANVSFHSLSPSRVYFVPTSSVPGPVVSTGQLAACLVSEPRFHQPQRAYNRKKTIKIPPTKPLNFDYSGDMKIELDPVDPSDLKPVFNKVEELQEADENVKKLFSLEYATGHEVLQKRLEDVAALVQEHPADIRSLEMKIAVWTIKIRNQMRHVHALRKDKRSKAMLIERIQKRRSKLALLKKRDIEKFEWLCKELDLVHIPLPQYNFTESKRAATKREAREKCIAEQRDKIELFRQKLEKEKESFQVEKELEMKRIREELSEFGVINYNSVEDVIKQLKLEDQFPIKKEPRKTRRQKILEMKFKKFEEQRKSETPT